MMIRRCLPCAPAAVYQSQGIIIDKLMPSSNVLIAVEEMREEVMDLIGVYHAAAFYWSPMPSKFDGANLCSSLEFLNIKTHGAASRSFSTVVNFG
jgi:hypothetical protein